MLCVCLCVCDCVCHVCEPQAQATYEPKKPVTYNCQTRFSYLCTPSGLPQRHFFSENAVSKKPLQANGQTWLAISC